MIQLYHKKIFHYRQLWQQPFKPQQAQLSWSRMKDFLDDEDCSIQQREKTRDVIKTTMWKN